MKILIVDDDALIRDSLKIIFELEDDFQVIGTAKNGEEAINICQLQPIDLVLMDIRMPVMDGVMATGRLKKLFPNIKIVILTTFKDDEYIKEALKNGAEGYILKSQSSDSIIESLRAVMMGNTVLEKEVATTLQKIISKERSKNNTTHNFTDRELQLMKLVGEGLSNKEISESLYLSEGTVRNYITSLLEKLELRDRTQLAIYYVKNLEE